MTSGARTRPGHPPAGGAATWFSRTGLRLPLPTGSRRGEHSQGGTWTVDAGQPCGIPGCLEQPGLHSQTRTDITHGTAPNISSLEPSSSASPFSPSPPFSLSQDCGLLRGPWPVLTCACCLWTVGTGELIRGGKAICVGSRASALQVIWAPPRAEATCGPGVGSGSSVPRDSHGGGPPLLSPFSVHLLFAPQGPAGSFQGLLGHPV